MKYYTKQTYFVGSTLSASGSVAAEPFTLITNAYKTVLHVIQDMHPERSHTCIGFPLLLYNLSNQL